VICQSIGQHRRGACNALGVGVIPVGAIFYIGDEGWWRGHYRGAPATAIAGCVRRLRALNSSSAKPTVSTITIGAPGCA
jgi:hypothetical protein